MPRPRRSPVRRGDQTRLSPRPERSCAVWTLAEQRQSSTSRARLRPAARAVASAKAVSSKRWCGPSPLFLGFRPCKSASTAERCPPFPEVTLSWISRSLARAGSVAAIAAALACAAPAARANADQTPDVWFAGTRLIFDHPELRGADVAVAT